jgi:hypothetical protein
MDNLSLSAEERFEILPKIPSATSKSTQKQIVLHRRYPSEFLAK